MKRAKGLRVRSKWVQEPGRFAGKGLDMGLRVDFGVRLKSGVFKGVPYNPRKPAHDEALQRVVEARLRELRGNWRTKLIVENSGSAVVWFEYVTNLMAMAEAVEVA